MSGSSDRPGRGLPRLADLAPFAATEAQPSGPAAGPPSGSRGEPRRGAARSGIVPPAAGPSAGGGVDFEPDADPVTRPDRVAPAGSLPAPDLYADQRDSGGSTRRRKPQQAPIVPAGSVTGRSLTMVIAIMCFLACLTSGAVYIMNQNATEWLRDIGSEITIQVEPRDKVDTDKTVREIVQLLQQTEGVRVAQALSIEASTGALEPWLGRGETLKSLPIPRLIKVELNASAPDQIKALRQLVESKHVGVSLDDHRQWTKQIRTVTNSFALGGFGILMLVGAATMAIIVSATRSALASNREIVEVLHFVGATDRFIAGEFQRHFLSLGIRAGVVGALAAMVVFFLLPVGLELMAGGQATMAEFRRFFGSSSLDLTGYLVLVGVVVVIAGLCMVTSRMGVFRILHTRQ